MDLGKIGACLKDLRKEKGLTQEQLAEQFNISQRTVSRWETGSVMPDLDVLLQLADFYEVDLRALLNGERVDEKMTQETKETVRQVVKYNNAKHKVWKKIFAGICIVLSVVLAALCLLTFLFVYAVHARREKVVQAMNNPYISSDFTGWKEIALEQETILKIPDEWSLILHNDEITIVGSNKTIAKGMRINWDDYNGQEKENKTLQKFNQETFSIIGDQEDVHRLNLLHSGMAAEYYLKTISNGDDKSETHYRISFSNDSVYYYLFDFGEEGKTDGFTRKIIEAIAYSFYCKRG